MDENRNIEIECPNCNSDEIYIVAHERTMYEIDVLISPANNTADDTERVSIEMGNLSGHSTEIDATDHYCTACDTFFSRKDIEDYLTEKYHKLKKESE